MNTLNNIELAAVSGGSVVPLSGPDLSPLPDQQAIEEFLAWWFQQTQFL